MRKRVRNNNPMDHVELIFQENFKELLNRKLNEPMTKAWYDPIKIKIRNEKLKDIRELIRNLNVHNECEKCRDGRVQALYCRLILEYICQCLFLIGLNNKKLNFSQLKRTYNCRKYCELFDNMSLEDIINKLQGQIVNRRDNHTTVLWGLMVSIQKSTNEALHILINNEQQIVKKEYNIKSIISSTERLIEEFNEKFA